MQLGTLEILGEVIHTFHEDRSGPPDELIALYVGNDKAVSPSTMKPLENHIDTVASDSHYLKATSSDVFYDAMKRETGEDSSDAEPEYEENDDAKGQSERYLICAFSFPAVALALGRARWGELRAFYATLAEKDGQEGGDGSSSKVRRTLAASIGEMAKIVGSEATLSDLLPVLYDTLRTRVSTSTGPCMMDVTREEEEIKIKAIECLEPFIEAIEETKRGPIGRELERIWVENLKGWRERDAFAKKLGGLSRLLRKYGDVVRGLVMKALVDPIASIREKAVDNVSVALMSTYFLTDRLLPSHFGAVTYLHPEPRRLHRCGRGSSS